MYSHTIHKLNPSVLHPPEGCTVPALSSLLSNNPLPRDKQSVLDLKEKGPCLYHVQLSSRQNASAYVWREKCCNWGGCFFHPPPFQNGDNGVGGLEQWEWMGGVKAWIRFLTPPSRSTARLIEASMRLFQLFCSLSFLLPWSGQTHSDSASTPLLCPCVFMYICTPSAYMCGLGHVLLVASGPLYPYTNSPSLRCTMA